MITISKSLFRNLLQQDIYSKYSEQGADIIYDNILELYDSEYEFDYARIRGEYSEYDIDEYISDYKDVYAQFLEDNSLIDEQDSKQEFFDDYIRSLSEYVGGDEDTFIIAE